MTNFVSAGPAHDLDEEIIFMYGLYRLRNGVMDSIRFTAAILEMKPIEVAKVLGLTTYFVEHR